MVCGYTRGISQLSGAALHRAAAVEYIGDLRRSLCADLLTNTLGGSSASASSTNVVEIVIASYESEVPQIFRLPVEHGVH